MYTNLLLMTISIAGGIIVGGALAAFITLIQLIPRLIQFSETYDQLKLYEGVFALGSFLSILVYFSNLFISIPNILLSLIALVMGTFIGFFSSALAEVLNVIPVLSKKLKIKKEK